MRRKRISCLRFIRYGNSIVTNITDVIQFEAKHHPNIQVVAPTRGFSGFDPYKIKMPPLKAEAAINRPDNQLSGMVPVEALAPTETAICWSQLCTPYCCRSEAPTGVIFKL